MSACDPVQMGNSREVGGTQSTLQSLELSACEDKSLNKRIMNESSVEVSAPNIASSD